MSWAGRHFMPIAALFAGEMEHITVGTVIAFLVNQVVKYYSDLDIDTRCVAGI